MNSWGVQSLVLACSALSLFSACESNKKPKGNVTQRGQMSGSERDTRDLRTNPSPQIPNQSDGTAYNPRKFQHVPLRRDGIIQYKAYTKSTLDPAEVSAWVEKFKQTDLYAQGKWKFVTMPNAYLSNPTDLNFARIGLSKAINMVSPQSTEIHNPVDISEGYGVVYAIDINKHWGERADHKWAVVSNAQYTRGFSRANRYKLEKFANEEVVAADRLAYNSMHSWNYNELTDHPYFRRPGRARPSATGIFGSLFGRLGNRDDNERIIASNPESAKGLNRLKAGKVTHRFAVKNAITFGPRFAQRRELEGWNGSLWESFDDFNGTVRDIPWLEGESVTPRNYGNGMMKQFGTTTSEAWYVMPNGLPAFMLFGNGAQERSTAEYSTVVDPLNVYGNNSQSRRTKHGKLVNGFCAFCHYQSVQFAGNDMWAAIQNGTFANDPAKEARAREYWSSDASLMEQYSADAKIYQQSFAKVVYGISGGEPEWLHQVVNGIIEKEPIYYLVADIMGLKDRGNTAGRRNGQAPGVGFEDRYRGGSYTNQ